MRMFDILITITFIGLEHNRLETLVEALTRHSNGQWQVTAKGRQEQFDVVLITIPVPEILALQGTIIETIGKNIYR